MRRTFNVQSNLQTPTRPLRVVLVGLGPIGKNVADECARRGIDRIEIVGAVDINPALVGKTLGELWGLDRLDGAVRVVAKASDLKGQGEVALLTTTSRLDTLEPQLEPLLAAGLNVVSSSEELFYPYLTDSTRAERIDALAKKYGRAVSGAGVNPGFLMDVLPVVLATVSGPPFTVRCERYVDLAKRRVPLQTKAGMGMDPNEFRALADTFKIGHVGLVESVAYLAGHLGLKITHVEESLEPVTSTESFSWQGKDFASGRTIGFEHQAWAWGEGGSAQDAPVKMFLRMSYNQEDSRDRIVLTGNPPIDLTIRPCTGGDAATAAILVHLAAQTPTAKPGLNLPHDLGLLPQGPRYFVSVV